MSDTDQSLYNLRYNQVTQGIEGFGGGTPQWTPLVLETGSGISQLTGIVSAGPGTGSQATTINLASAHLIVGNGSNVGTAVSLSGDATLANTGALTLSTVNGNVGSFTSANITVDAKGRITAAASGSGATPGGSDTQVQYNSSGTFAGSAKLAWDDTDSALSISNTGGSTVAMLDLIDSNGSEGTQIRMRSNNQSAIIMFDSAQSNQFATIEMDQGTPAFVIKAHASNTPLVLQVNADNTTTKWSFQTDGGLALNPLGAEPGSPVEGELIYNSATHHMEYYNGTTWVSL